MNIVNEQFINEMKKRIPNHPILKIYFEDLKEDGLTDEQALDVMITNWLSDKNGE